MATKRAEENTGKNQFSGATIPRVSRMTVAMPERLDLREIRRLDRDFDWCRLNRREPFERVQL
jgi:hypothetical protein